MDKILDYSQISDAIKSVRSRKEGFLTNFYFDQKRCELLIEKGLLYVAMIGNTCFIYYQDKDFFHLYFVTTSSDELCTGLQVIAQSTKDRITVDIIGSSVTVQDAKRLFEAAGFNAYCSLKRMTRIGNNEVYPPIKEIGYGTEEDGKVVYDILQDFFDLYAEQLPLIEEVNKWMENNHLLVYKAQGKIAGFVLFDLIGLTSYLRYWFVHPDFREQGVGACLLRHYFYESRNTKRQLFWVINTNENAIKRYKHYGFSEENLIDEILILN